MVRTFEFVEEELRELSEAPSLAVASKALPTGAYTTLRTYRGDRVLRLERHVARLLDSAGQMGASSRPLPEPRVRRALAQALRAAGHAESRARLTWAPPRLFLSIEPFEPPAPSLHRDGAWCVTVTVSRERPQAKDSRFVATAAGTYERLPPGAHEGLMRASDGALLEGLSSNFFAILGGVLRSESERVLPGVTRSLVLQLARELLPVSLTAVHVDDLPQVAEAFITSVSRGIVPVVRIDDRAIGDGRPGPLTRELMRRFDALAEREAVSVGDQA